MRREVPILIFILILILRQGPVVRIAENNPCCHSIIQETNQFSDTAGLGSIEDTKNDDPIEMPTVFRAFQNEEQSFIGAGTLKHFTCLFHRFSNPLLIDIPPPVFCV